MNNTEKFTGIAATYAKWRPTYSPKCIDYLIKECQLSKTSTLADIGSGTGILSKLLLDRELKVLSVEPNNDMRMLSKALLSNYQNSTIINATAEDTKLQPESINVVVVGQAFHWFNKKQFLIECRRILKATGKVAILYNNGDYSSDVVVANSEISKLFCPMYKGPSGGINNDPNIFEDFYLNGTYKYGVFANDFKLTLNQFIGLNCSASYALKLTDKKYQEYLDALTDLFNRYCKDGILTMPNNTTCRLGYVKSNHI